MATTTTARKPLNGEPLKRLSEVAAHFPGAHGAGTIHPATLTRWINQGVKCRGKRVRLEGVRMGSVLFTSWEAVERFNARLAAPDPDADTTPPADSVDDAAGRALERMGA